MNSSEESTVRLDDGATTVVQRWGERGPLVVGVHGLGSSRRGWARIGERLAGSFRTVAYDQRGHGDASAGEPMTFARSLADLRDVLASLGEPVHALMGHSWGGAIVVGGGRELDVARVVAIDPMLRVEPGVWSASVLPEYIRQFAQPLDAREASVRASYAALPEVELEAKLHATRRLRFDPIAALGTDNAIEAGGWDFGALVRSYPRPLLFALADPKRSVVSEREREAFRLEGGPQVQVEVLAGASHSLQRDAFERFAPLLEGFLAAAGPAVATAFPSGKSWDRANESG